MLTTTLTVEEKQNSLFPEGPVIKAWFTLATESEAESESEAQGALRSSVNQKSESEAESEA